MPSAMVTDAVAVHFSFAFQHVPKPAELLAQFRVLARNTRLHEQLSRAYTATGSPTDRAAARRHSRCCGKRGTASVSRAMCVPRPSCRVESAETTRCESTWVQ
eukprot:6422383-Prymnesium_polylepis.1